jgi:hypothetical protein
VPGDGHQLVQRGDLERDVFRDGQQMDAGLGAAQPAGPAVPARLRRGDQRRPAPGSARRRITAVAALGDDLAIGTLAALSDLGLSSPGDLAVIGFDDTAHGALWRPAITTVHIDARAYGRRTARTILGLPVGDAQPAPARVIERATT